MALVANNGYLLVAWAFYKGEAGPGAAEYFVHVTGWLDKALDRAGGIRPYTYRCRQDHANDDIYVIEARELTADTLG